MLAFIGFGVGVGVRCREEALGRGISQPPRNKEFLQKGLFPTFGSGSGNGNKYKMVIIITCHK
jgi:hypothetical protein